MEVKDYDYTLKFYPFFNQEEIIAGRQARFVIPVELKLNEESVSLSNLKNSSIHFTFHKSEGTTQKKQFNDLNLSDSKDLVLETIIPSKVQSIQIEIKAEIQRKKVITL